MSRGYRLTPEAEAHLDEICAFIAEDNVDAALRVLDAFEHAFDQLASTPEMGHTASLDRKKAAIIGASRNTQEDSLPPSQSRISRFYESQPSARGLQPPRAER